MHDPGPLPVEWAPPPHRPLSRRQQAVEQGLTGEATERTIVIATGPRP